MKYDLHWDDIGRSTKPGPYPFKGYVVQVRLVHLHRWYGDPEGIWEVHSLMGYRGKSRLAIRAFRASGSDENAR